MCAAYKGENSCLYYTMSRKDEKKGMINGVHSYRLNERSGVDAQGN